MNLGRPSKVHIKPNEEKTEFRFQMWFPERRLPADFHTSAEGAMLLMHALQHLQALHKIPIPKGARPAGRPKLRVVTDD
jgi:hypothetical protein